MFFSLEDFFYQLRDTYRSFPLWFRKLIGSSYRALPNGIKYGVAYPRTKKMIQRTDQTTRKELGDLQFSLLKKLLKHCVDTVPYYANAFANAGLNTTGFNSISDIESYPLLERSTIRKNPKDFLSSAIPPSQRLKMNTGGSTGFPLTLWYEKGVSRAREWAFMHALWKRTGWTDKSRSVMLRGWHVPKGLWQYEPIRHRLIVSAFHLNRETLPVYVSKIRDFDPDFIEAYPSNISMVAAYMKQNGLPPFENLKAVLAGSENIFPAQRSLIEESLGCRVFSWYGHGEICALAGECEDSSEYHVFPQYGYVELVDSQGNVIEKANQLGEIVATGFNNRAMPLIRYRTGDMACWAEGPCSCGREYRRFSRIEGRKGELVVGNDGTVVTLTALIFGQHFTAFDQIAKMQIVQENPGFLHFRIQPVNRDFNTESETEIRSKIDEATGGNFAMDFEMVETIETLPSGKHAFLIQELDINEYMLK